MEKFVLCIPKGGFNDQLSQMELCYTYCKKFNRTLLIETKNSVYNKSFHEYFSFHNPEIKIICNSDEIKKITKNRKLRINNGNNKNSYGRSFLTFSSFSGYDQDFSKEKDFKEDILVHRGCGKGYPKTLLKLLRFDEKILSKFKERYEKIEKPYLCLYIRNTDRKSDFKKLYRENKDLIDSYKSIYVATDNKDVLNYFKKEGLKFHNFTTFGKNTAPLHSDRRLDNDIKIIDMICDMLLVGLSEKMLTNSGGGFTRLCTHLHENKDWIHEKNLI